VAESGVEAAVQAALDAAVALRTYVPGYPVTALGEALQAQIAVNEKVALEIALGRLGHRPALVSCWSSRWA